MADSTAPVDDYPPEVYAIVAQAEPRHYWFGARNDVILSALRRSVGRLAGCRLIDIGCGTGFVLQAFETAGVDAWGIDMHLTALRTARGRVRAPLVWSSAARLPFDADFDAATLCDVIEHTSDDAAVVAEAARVVVPGGVVLVTVPAGPHLWTEYDRVIGHKRRYTRASLSDVFERAGLQTLSVQYFNCLPAVVQRLHRRVASFDAAESAAVIVARALAQPPAIVNAVLRWYVPREAWIGRMPMITGASLVGIARRRDV